MDQLFTKDNIYKYFKKNLQNYSKCKIQQYFMFSKNKNKYYVSPSSYKQIRTIIKISDKFNSPLIYGRLLNLFLKHIRMKDLSKFLKITQKNDKDIFEKLSKYSKRKLKGGDIYCTKNILFSQYYTSILKKLFKNKQINNYLGIGCATCEKTYIFGKHLGLDHTNIYGADIKAWGPYKSDKRNTQINFTEYNEGGNLPFQNNKFSVISVIMVLHHVQKLKQMLSEIHRIIQKDGCLFVIEHDVFTDTDRMLADIEHSIYYYIHENNTNYVKDYYAIYRNWIEWNIIMEHMGFKYIQGGVDTRSIRVNVTETRSYYSIYKRI